MAFTPEQQKQHRANLLDMGICILCHKRPVKPGTVQCQPCLTGKQDFRRLKRRKKEYCSNCCKKLDDYTLATGGCYCMTCHERDNDRQRKRRSIKENR